MPKIDIVTLILTLHFSILNVDVNKGEKNSNVSLDFFKIHVFVTLTNCGWVSQVKVQKAKWLTSRKLI